MDADNFISELRDQNIERVYCVPCNHASPLILALLKSAPDLYVSCPNEAVAYSTALGYVLGGGRAIVICQSSGVPNLLNALVSFSHAYSLYVPVLTSWRTYTPESPEIQHRFLADGLGDLIVAAGASWTILPDSIDMLRPALQRGFSEPTFFVFKKNSFEKISHTPMNPFGTDTPTRMGYLRKLKAKLREVSRNICVVATTGHTAREAGYLFDKVLLLVGNMGGGLSVSLGLTRGYDCVIFLGGDGEFVMQMGGLVNASRPSEQSGKLVYLMFDNKQNKSTGGQPTFQDHVDYYQIAKGSGWSIHDKSVSSLSQFEDVVDWAIDAMETRIFIHIQCNLDDEVSRQSIEDIYKKFRSVSKGAIL